MARIGPPDWLKRLNGAVRAAISARIRPDAKAPGRSARTGDLRRFDDRQQDPVFTSLENKMKRLLLERKASGPNETEGFLTLNGTALLATIERPWIDASTPGGKPFASCVPAGVYDLKPHTRPDGKEVVALINPALGVYYEQSDVPDTGGRYLILIHVGNWATDVVGCVAPGRYHSTSPQGPMVKSSANAMKQVMDFINGDDAQIEIRWI